MDNNWYIHDVNRKRYSLCWWDRRTIIRKAKDETIDYLEREGKLRKLIEALRERAKTDKELEAILKKCGLL
ncbi:hypothetical protein JCM9492_17410 [Aquifex pyrophilus]